MAHEYEGNDEQRKEEADLADGTSDKGLTCSRFTWAFWSKYVIEDYLTEQAHDSHNRTDDLDSRKPLTNQESIQSLDEELRIVLEAAKDDILRSFKPVSLHLIALTLSSYQYKRAQSDVTGNDCEDPTSKDQITIRRIDND